MSVKKITVSSYAGYDLYYFVSEGKQYFNYSDKGHPMSMASDNLTSALLGYIRDAATAAFRKRKWKYKTYKAMIESQRECFAQTSKQAYRDIQTNLDLA